MQDVDPITVTVGNQSGRNVSMKIRPDAPTRKLFNAVEEAFGLDRGSFHLIFDGIRLLGEGPCLKSYGVEDGDQLLQVLPQLGGVGSLEDFDWSCRITISSDKISNLRQPILALKLALKGDNGEPVEKVVEMTTAECEMFLRSLVAARQALTQFR
jgi:hypothetical protein